jgi:5-methylcytosine-specific restriction endonuclease McrA
MGAREHRILAVIGTDATFERRAHGGEAVWVGKCIFCGRALVIGANGVPRSRATLEHIVARAQGGGDDVENLALACAGCNQEKGKRHDHKRKGDARLAEVVAALQARRRQRWREADEVGLGAHVARVRRDAARAAAPDDAG